MANKEKLANIARAHGIEQSEPETPERNYDDPVEQTRILHPDAKIVKLSYGDVRLFPLAVAGLRRATAFISAIVADVRGFGASDEVNSGLRITQILMSNAQKEAELFLHVAYASGKPGTVDPEQAQKIATEIAEHAAPGDVVLLFTALTNLVQGDAGPKGGVAAKKTISRR